MGYFIMLLKMIIFSALGTCAGIYVGAIPGISVTMAVSLLISLTYSWDTVSAIAVIIGVYIGGVYGGSRSAIMLNIPGGPSSIATTFDGYPLAKKGLASQAIALSTIMSVLGGLIGVVFLLFGANIISSIAILIGSKEYFLISLIGITLVGSIGIKSPYKGWFMACLGIFIGCIGIDPLTSNERFTFGNMYLKSGINYIVVMIGLFSISEVLYQFLQINTKPIKQNVENIKPNFKQIAKYFPCCIRSSIIGTIIGSLPGTGGEISALIAYDVEKKINKNPEIPFGEGAFEGIVAPESANNSAIGGALIPALVLGIPGDTVTAIIIGALQIQGIKTGPTLMSNSYDIFIMIIALLIISNIFLLFFGLTGIKIFSKLVEIPKQILFPIILVISIVGVYSVNNNFFDVITAVVFGIMGYIFRKFGYPASPLVLGMILSQTIDTNFRRAIIQSGSITAFIRDILTQPISFTLIVILVIMFYLQFKQSKN